MNLLKPTARCFRLHLGKSRTEYGISVYLFLRKLPSFVWESICLHPWVRKQAPHPKPLLQEAMISSPCLAAKKESGNNSMVLENDINLELILIKVGFSFNVEFHFLCKHLCVVLVSVMYKSKNYGWIAKPVNFTKICKESTESDALDKCFVMYWREKKATVVKRELERSKIAYCKLSTWRALHSFYLRRLTSSYFAIYFQLITLFSKIKSWMKAYLVDTRHASRFYGAWSLYNLESQLEGEKKDTQS